MAKILIILFSFPLSAFAGWQQHNGEWSYVTDNYREIAQACEASLPEIVKSDYYEVPTCPPGTKLCVTSPSSQPGYDDYQKAKRARDAQKQGCINSKVEAQAAASKPPEVEFHDGEGNKMNSHKGGHGDIYSVAVKPQPRVCDGLVFGHGDPCAELPPGSKIHPDGTVERAQEETASSSPSSSGDSSRSPASVDQGFESQNEASSDSVPQVNTRQSCSQQKRNEIRDKYRRSAFVLKSVFEARVKEKDCT